MQPELRPPLYLGLQYSQPEKEFFYLKVLPTTLIFPSILPRLLHFNLVYPQIKILYFIKTILNCLNFLVHVGVSHYKKKKTMKLANIGKKKKKGQRKQNSNGP